MRYILIFSNHFPNETFGGMEAHCNALAEWATSEKELNPLLISMHSMSIKNKNIVQPFSSEESLIGFLTSLGVNNTSIFFFNDGYWIEWIHALRQSFPQSVFFFRSGGNDLLYAPTSHMSLPIEARREYWVDVFNNDVNHVIVNSEFSLNNFINCGVQESKLVKLRGGVDYKRCIQFNSTREERRRQFYKDYNLDDNITLLCICARFVPFKGISMAIEAIARLSTKDKIHLILVGDGPEREAILELCKQSDVSYTYLGAQSQNKALSYMSIADVLLNTSILYQKQSGTDSYIHTETMGRSMMEAITLGIPIVATDVGGTRELFIENEGMDIGILCSCDVNSISLAINKITNISMKAKVGNKYDWEIIFNKYKELCEKDFCL